MKRAFLVLAMGLSAITLAKSDTLTLKGAVSFMGSSNGLVKNEPAASGSVQFLSGVELQTDYIHSVTDNRSLNVEIESGIDLGVGIGFRSKDKKEFINSFIYGGTVAPRFNIQYEYDKQIYFGVKTGIEGLSIGSKGDYITNVNIPLHGIIGVNYKKLIVELQGGADFIVNKTTYYSGKIAVGYQLTNW